VQQTSLLAQITVGHDGTTPVKAGRIVARLQLLMCAGVGVVALACGARQVQVPGPAGELSVPAALIDRATALWPGSGVRAGAGCPATGDGAAAAPAALTADLNGDGAPDVILRLEGEGRAHLVAAFARLDGAPELIDVTEDEGLGPGALSVRPGGARYVREGSGLDFYFGADTLVLTGCDGVRTAFLWTGSGFERVRLAK
jgi:hypothetical protein